jgi:hypothetical protein
MPPPSVRGDFRHRKETLDFYWGCDVAAWKESGSEEEEALILQKRLGRESDMVSRDRSESLEKVGSLRAKKKNMVFRCFLTRNVGGPVLLKDGP